jgi:hypothetical protein
MARLLPSARGSPGGFALTRAGTKLHLRWKRAPAVTRYVLKVRLSDDRGLLYVLTPRQTQLTVSGTSKQLRATAPLQVQNSFGILGKAASARLKR